MLHFLRLTRCVPHPGRWHLRNFNVSIVGHAASSFCASSIVLNMISALASHIAKRAQAYPQSTSTALTASITGLDPKLQLTLFDSG